MRNKIFLFDIDHTLFDTEKFKASKLTDFSLYDEILGVLEKLSKVAELGILSQGELEFQKAKLKNADIERFFKEHNVHIFEDKNLNLERVLSQYEDYQVFFVDDRLDMLQSAKKFMPSVVTVWIKRGPHAEKLKEIEDFIPDKAILNLKELTCIIDSCRSNYAKKN